MSVNISTSDQGLGLGPLAELAWRDFWRHPKAGNGQEGPVRLFFLNHFPALGYLAALVLLVVGTYGILGIREATDQQYEQELANPFIWWVSVLKDTESTASRDAAGSLLPEHFWQQEVPYLRYRLHLVPDGKTTTRDALGRSFQPADPALEQAAANLVWPEDPELFLASARAGGRYGIVLTRFLYERILGYTETPEFPLVVHKWSRREHAVPIPVLGVVEYLPDGEFLISEEFVEAFVSGTWREQLFTSQAWVWLTNGAGGDAALEAVSQAEVRLRDALAGLEMNPSLEVTGLEGQPALFLRFAEDRVARAHLLQALAKSELLGGSWTYKTGQDRVDDAGRRIRYDRVAYVVEQDVDLVAAMVDYCREVGLQIDASILLRAGALVRGREHFLSQSRMVLWLNWAAALGLLITVMMYKTHGGIHNFGVYLALGGQESDGYRIAALQFFTIFAGFLTSVILASVAVVTLGAREGGAFYAFFPWDPGYGGPLLGMTIVAFGAIVFIRAYLHHRLWPSQMILYRE